MKQIFKKFLMGKYPLWFYILTSSIWLPALVVEDTLFKGKEQCDNPRWLDVWILFCLSLGTIAIATLITN